MRRRYWPRNLTLPPGPPHVTEASRNKGHCAGFRYRSSLALRCDPGLEDRLDPQASDPRAVGGMSVRRYMLALPIMAAVNTATAPFQFAAV